MFPIASTAFDRPANAVAFATELGWMALAIRGKTIRELTFGYATAVAARAALESQIAGFVLLDGEGLCLENDSSVKLDSWVLRLVENLRAYARGRRVDFSDVAIDTPEMSDFGRRVIRACRKIAYGTTASYGDLAAEAGRPAAARAVGRRMATNRIPIIVPCHRVVPAGGRSLGGFTAPGGVQMKRRLLEMESRA